MFGVQSFNDAQSAVPHARHTARKSIFSAERSGTGVLAAPSHPVPQLFRSFSCLVGVSIWLWLKIKRSEGLRRFWSMFPLPGFHFGTGLLSLSHLTRESSSLFADLNSDRGVFPGKAFAPRPGSRSSTSPAVTPVCHPTFSSMGFVSFLHLCIYIYIYINIYIYIY